MLLGAALVGFALTILFVRLELPSSVLIGVAKWSPMILILIAFLLLVAATGPRRVVFASLLLALVGCLGLIATHGVVGSQFWWLLLAGLLACAGGILVMSGVRSRKQPNNTRPGAPIVRRRFWRSGTVDQVPAEADAIALTACFADVVLELPYAGQLRNIELEITVVFGTVIVRVPKELERTEVVMHRPFVLGAGRLTTSPPLSNAVNTLNEDEPAPPPALTAVVVGLGGDAAVRHDLDNAQTTAYGARPTGADPNAEPD